jgi:hypothetical protein
MAGSLLARQDLVELLLSTAGRFNFIPLPLEFQKTFVSSAGLAPNAQESVPAKALLQFLSGREGMSEVRAKGMDPVASK